MVSTRRFLIGPDPRRTLVRIGVLAALSVITFGWVLMPIRAEGISMQPTFDSGTLHVVNRLSYGRRGPVRGDVVAIRMPGERVVYIKRIVGLPGERLSIAAGQVMIDGRSLDEPYVRARRAWTMEEVALGPDQYFVIGDNRGMDLADHTFGRVDSSRIIGRLVF